MSSGSALTPSTMGRRRRIRAPRWLSRRRFSQNQRVVRADPFLMLFRVHRLDVIEEAVHIAEELLKALKRRHAGRIDKDADPPRAGDGTAAPPRRTAPRPSPRRLKASHRRRIPHKTWRPAGPPQEAPPAYGDTRRAAGLRSQAVTHTPAGGAQRAVDSPLFPPGPRRADRQPRTPRTAYTYRRPTSAPERRSSFPDCGTRHSAAGSP